MPTSSDPSALVLDLAVALLATTGVDVPLTWVVDRKLLVPKFLREKLLLVRARSLLGPVSVDPSCLRGVDLGLPKNKIVSPENTLSLREKAVPRMVSLNFGNNRSRLDSWIKGREELYQVIPIEHLGVSRNRPHDEATGRAAERQNEESTRMEVEEGSSCNEEEKERKADEVEDKETMTGSPEELASKDDEILDPSSKCVGLESSLVPPTLVEEGKLPTYVLSDYKDRASRIARNPLKAALNRRSGEDWLTIPAPAPILSLISSSSQTRFLLLWNNDAFHCWPDRVHHTLDKDNHLFWLTPRDHHSATLFRDLVAGRQTVDDLSIGCDFVSGEVSNDFVPVTKDSWDPTRGLKADLSLTESLRTEGLPKLPLSQHIRPAQDSGDSEFSALSRKNRRKLAKDFLRTLPPYPSTPEPSSSNPSTSFFSSNLPFALEAYQWTCLRKKRKHIVTNTEDTIVNVLSNLWSKPVTIFTHRPYHFVPCYVISIFFPSPTLEAPSPVEGDVTSSLLLIGWSKKSPQEP
ncbi:LOW QUALITY PROTEIN: hypothetical protein CVT26_003962 [Gymnopilus dilepis]|uniref:Uncharacterized protein n=1 Tax=Gymnopilus dilepis TaxID=231916 RepID=A0A409WKD4_9AGAR|nr:LOW QUALITY PROTEIN: hypothetical protein CVT26_003962 [Gymnopilus dilepis]